MSVKTEINRIIQNVSNAYSVLNEIGADMPGSRNTNNLTNTVSSVKNKIAIVADKIRVMLDLSTEVELDEMSSCLDTAQNEVDTQADLIEQIRLTLQGKAVVNADSLPSGVNALASGTFVLTQDYPDGSTPYTVKHGMSRAPNFFTVFSETGEVLDKGLTNTAVNITVLTQRTSYGPTYNTLQEIVMYTSVDSNKNLVSSLSGAGSRGTYMSSTDLNIWVGSTYKLAAGVTYRWIAGHADNLTA